MLISSRDLSVYGKIDQNLGSALIVGTMKTLSVRSELHGLQPGVEMFAIIALTQVEPPRLTANVWVANSTENHSSDLEFWNSTFPQFYSPMAFLDVTMSLLLWECGCVLKMPPSWNQLRRNLKQSWNLYVLECPFSQSVILEKMSLGPSHLSPPAQRETSKYNWVSKTLGTRSGLDLRILGICPSLNTKFISVW